MPSRRFSTPRRTALAAAVLLAADSAAAEERGLFLLDADGARLRLGAVDFAPQPDGAGYRIDWDESLFGDHFLSMRPFRCLEGPEQLWCRVPYPYENRRDLSSGDLTDLEYDLLFVWKEAGAYGIDLWNGVYYRLARREDGTIRGAMHEIDLGLLAAPPEDGDLRPVGPEDMEPAEPDGRWLPALVIE